MWPRNASGVGTVAEAGKWSTRAVENCGPVVASRINRVYSTSHSGWRSSGSAAPVVVGAWAGSGGRPAARTAGRKNNGSRRASGVTMGRNLRPRHRAIQGGGSGCGPGEGSGPAASPGGATSTARVSLTVKLPM